MKHVMGIPLPVALNAQIDVLEFPMEIVVKKVGRQKKRPDQF